MSASFLSDTFGFWATGTGFLDFSVCCRDFLVAGLGAGTVLFLGAGKLGQPLQFAVWGPLQLAQVAGVSGSFVHSLDACSLPHFTQRFVAWQFRDAWWNFWHLWH